MTQAFLFPYSWSSIWSNLSPGAELICSTLSLCQVHPSHLLSLLCPVPNPSSLPLHSFLLIPVFSCQPLTAACLSGVTVSAFILKVRYKETLQDPDIKSARKSALRWPAVWRYSKYTFSSRAEQQVLVHLQTTLEAIWSTASLKCFKE